MEHADYDTTAPAEISADGLEQLVDRLVAEARLFAEEAGAYAEQQLDVASAEGGLSYWASPSAVAALDEYVESVDWATRNFKQACYTVLHLQGKYDAEVDRIFGTERWGNGHRPVMAGDPKIEVLTGRILAVAARYADEVEGSRSRFNAAWETYEKECEEQLALLRDALAHAHEVDAALLSQAALETQQSGRVCLPFGLSAAGGAAAVVYAAMVSRVSSVLSAASDAASAAQDVWEYLTQDHLSFAAQFATHPW
ncbi:hypothetical protein [Streptomyces sp. NPDC057910]|uniref:hypothetical protein n=1 Tax=Streptomyces sp. NPDC057910 TaxID=3346278 RepID=UPI0036DFADD9